MNKFRYTNMEGIVEKNFISSKQQKISCIKTENTEEVDGIKVTIYGSKDIIQLKSLERWKM